MGLEIAITRIDDYRIINWSKVAYGYISHESGVEVLDLYFTGMANDTDDHMTFRGETAERLIKMIPWLFDDDDQG